MKNAFTMIELVFVIVIVGILSLVISSSFERNTLREAADQVVSHIRYTQHLAMVDDKFVPNPEMSKEGSAATRLLESQEWYKGRWHILFSTTANGTISYSIISDSTKSTYDGNPSANFNSPYSEVARDPANPTQYLIGTTYTSFDNDKDRYINPKLDLKKTYVIMGLSIAGGSTGSTATRIIFDSLGRPYRGAITSLTSSTNRLATTRVTIKLCMAACTNPQNTANNAEEVVIGVEPESGYAHIL